MATEAEATLGAEGGRSTMEPAPAETDEAGRESAPEGGTQDAPAASEDDLGVQLSLEEVSPPLRPVVEKHLRNYEKQFKAAYTKKTMTLAEERKAREAEYSQLKNSFGQLEALAVEVLRDPSKLEAYRKQYGLPSGGEPNTGGSAEKPIETVEDLFAVMDQKLNEKLSTVEKTVRETAAQENARVAAVSRWDTALSAWRQDPKFVKYEKIVVGMADDEKYKRLYTGKNEKEILGKAYEDFKSMFREDLEAAKNEGLKAVETKKKASTLQPGKTVNTKSTSDGPRSREEIIQAVRARVGK